MYGGKEKRKAVRTDAGESANPVQQHAFLTDPSEVKRMEKGLLDLMRDFNDGKLHEFAMVVIIK